MKKITKTIALTSTFIVLGVGLASCSNQESNTSSSLSDSVTQVSTEEVTNLVDGVNLAQSIGITTTTDYEKALTLTTNQALSSTVVVYTYEDVTTTYSSGFGPNAKTTTMTENELYCFGSGVIYYKAEVEDGGYYYKLITNEHVVNIDDDSSVVSGSASYTIYDANYDTEISATLIGYDSNTDIAVLSFYSDREYSAVTFEQSSNITVGKYVIACGTPLSVSYYNTVTFGIISRISSSQIQHDAAINSGNSGGSLFDLYGNLVGINNAKLSGESSSGASIDGINFAIHIITVYNSVVSITGTDDIVWA